MSQNPNPLNRQSLSRASIAGLGLAIGGIVLFFVLYIVLGNMGVDALARVIVALCVPPAVMASIVGGYFLLRPTPTTRVEPPSTGEERSES